ncbi:MAG: nucleotidyltransferase family protein [Aigarchaeota archaeon]|nr:nucleotidyltransferase family protein [Candidatus Wolframiiraptor gerlachensis]
MRAAILAGGYGKRLRPLTETIPKPLLSIGDKGIIEWQISWLKHHGISEIVVCAGYLKERIVERLGDGSRYGVKIEYAFEERPLGTGGALKNARRLLEDEDLFLLVNGDVLTDLNPLKLVDALIDGYIAVIALIPLPSPYGIVQFDHDTWRIIHFAEKPRIRDYWINAGIYAMRPAIFDYLPDEGNMERITLPVLAERGLLRAYPYDNCTWLSIDSHKDLEEASKIIPNLSIFKGY